MEAPRWTGRWDGKGVSEKGKRTRLYTLREVGM